MKFYKIKCINCDAIALAEENNELSQDYNFICVGNGHKFHLTKALYPKEDFEEISGQEYRKFKKDNL